MLYWMNRIQYQAFMTHLRNVAAIADFSATTDSASGADQIGVTTIAGVTGTKVQAVLEWIAARLQAVTNGVSGADLIGATAISGWAGATVQAILESAKAAVDAKKERASTNVMMNAGNVTASIAATMAALALATGKITEAGFALVTAGADATDALSYELDIKINTVSIFTTLPKLNYHTTVAAALASTLVAGTGVTVGVINAAANSVVLGDHITYTLTRVATTPDTEAAGALMSFAVEYAVV